MIKILPIKNFQIVDMMRIVGAYTCYDTFQVNFVEEASTIKFSLNLVPLPQPVERRYDHIDENWIQKYFQPSEFAFGAYEGDLLVGFLVAEKREWNKSLWVWDFHVDAKWRRLGIGRMLMDHLAEKALAAGLRIIVCETQNQNSTAIKVYRKLGFHLEGIDLSYYTNQDYPDKDIAVFMKRRLN